MPKAKETDINERTDLSQDEVFIGIGQENGGGLFVQRGMKMVRLEHEGPAFQAIMNAGGGGVRKARAASARTSSL